MGGIVSTATFVLCALGSLLGSTIAQAQQPSDQDAVAAAQFDRGLAAMNQGNYEIGCPALTESVRLDPRPGAIFTLAECEARWGHVASADAHYADYLARFARMTADQQRQQRNRDKIAEQKRAELRAQIPQLSLRLPDGATSAVVRRDGLVLGAPSLGVFLPVDPGAHVVTVSMPDGGKSEQTVTIELSARREVVLEVPAPVPGAPPPTPAPHDVTTVAPSTPWLAYGAFGVGAIGVGIGIVEGLGAISKKSTIEAHCDGTVCDPDGKSAADSASGAALVSTVGFAVGAAGVVAGIVLLLTRPSPPSSSARTSASSTTLPFFSIDAHTAGVGARGTF